MLVSMARPKLSEEAVRQIKALIESGELKAGDKLPTERELTGQLEVGRGSVREALRALEAVGLIEVRRGRGIFVRGGGNGETADKSTLPFDVQESDFEDLMEVRSIVETRACVLAAQRAGPEDFEAMQAAIDQMREALAAGDIAGVVLGDMAFHDAIIRATKNKLLVRLEAAVAHQLMDGRRLSFSTHGAPSRSIDRHQAIMKAIKAGDGEWAGSMTLDGIKILHSRILSAKAGDRSR